MIFCPISGRVHSAMVSKLNPGQRSVTVEWYERGETKGKEVELDMLLALNPELIQSKQPYAAPPPTTTAPINLQRVSIRDFLLGDAILTMTSRKVANNVQPRNEIATA